MDDVFNAKYASNQAKAKPRAAASVGGDEAGNREQKQKNIWHEEYIVEQKLVHIVRKVVVHSGLK